FSPIDVLEEYTRPARYVSNGEVVVRPALSEVELIDFPGVGTTEGCLPTGVCGPHTGVLRGLDGGYKRRNIHLSEHMSELDA
ncbi:MAG: hypothetical protein MUF84_17625, partial [Anaerolineae bacterium]|nr:hypothetical protein [Anaerolineae bacterium]